MTLNNPIPMQVPTKCLCGRLLAPIFLLLAQSIPCSAKPTHRNRCCRLPALFVLKACTLLIPPLGRWRMVLGRKCTTRIRPASSCSRTFKSLKTSKTNSISCNSLGPSGGRCDFYGEGGRYLRPPGGGSERVPKLRNQWRPGQHRCL